MEVAGKLKRVNSGFRVRSVALPIEHGGWSLLFEPIVLGLLLVPSLTGLFISIAATGAFLARHPFKLAVRDWRRKQHNTRTSLAKRFAITYAVIALVSLVLAVKTGGPTLLLPVLLVAPLVILQLFYDSIGHSRALIPELAGAISTGAIAAAIAVSGGWPHAASFGLWAILICRMAPTILYLRARLRLMHRKPASSRLVIVAHVLAVLMVIGLASVALSPYLAVLAVVILLLRALIGFSKSDREITAKKLGLREVAFGAITVLTVALGYALKL